MILSEDWNGMMRVLVTETGDVVNKGDTVTDFRGNTSKVRDGRAPHKPSSSGFVYTDRAGQSYPGVFDLKWVDAVEVTG